MTSSPAMKPVSPALGVEIAMDLELAAVLRAAIADPRLGYRHRWRPGDFVFWDSIVPQHARDDFDPARPRTLRRTPELEREGADRFPRSRDASLPAAAG